MTPNPNPCPWCGAWAYAWQSLEEPMVQVRCLEGDCYARGPIRRGSTYAEAEGRAVEAWNGSEPLQRDRFSKRYATGEGHD